MKVPAANFEGRLLWLAQRIGDTMPSKLHKWIGGAMLAKGLSGAETLLASLSDKDGMVDLDEVKKIVDAGFKASGGDVVIPFRTSGLLANIVDPVNVKITKADADEFFAGF